MASLYINIIEEISNTLYIPKEIFDKERHIIESTLSVSFNSVLKGRTYYLAPRFTIERSLHALKKWNEELHQVLLDKNIPHNLSITSISGEFPHSIHKNWLHWFNDLGEAKTEVYSRYIISEVDLITDAYKEKIFDASIAVSRYKSSAVEFDRYMHTEPNQVALRDIYLGRKLLST